MPAAALAMAPRHPFWLAIGDKPHGATKAPTLSLAAHLAFLPRGHWLEGQVTVFEVPRPQVNERAVVAAPRRSRSSQDVRAERLLS